MDEDNISQRQFRAELERLERALAEQTEWLKNWHLDMMANTTGGSFENRAQNDNQAPFRQWYYGQAPGMFDDSPVFAALGFSLESMQAQARHLSSSTRQEGPFPVSEYKAFMDSVVSFNDLVFKLQRESWNLISRVDELTGLGNEAAMRDQIEIERERARRTNQPTCVALADLTLYEPVQASAGQIGEAEVLVKLADALEVNLRLYDKIYRYDDDIFLICLPNTDPEIAGLVVNRLHELIIHRPLVLDDNTAVQVDLAFGIAPINAEETVQETIAHVAVALEKAATGESGPVVCWSA